MPGTHAIAAALALADYLETYTNDIRLENILRLAEALEPFSNGRPAVLSPKDLADLLEKLPPDVVDGLQAGPEKRARW